MTPEGLIAKIKENGIRLDVFDSSGIKIAELLPVNAAVVNDGDLLAKLVKWRNNAMLFFKTQFAATEASTALWLKEIVTASNQRILFWVIADGKYLGHFGLCNVSKDMVELDNAIRGEKGGHAELFKFVERRLLHFAFMELGVKRVTAKVLSRNFIALQMHKELGLVEIKRHPLRMVKSDDRTEYKECGELDANVKITYIELGIESHTLNNNKNGKV
jgi:RimJ/RimL family protein N-acetyltransferase